MKEGKYTSRRKGQRSYGESDKGGRDKYGQGMLKGERGRRKKLRGTTEVKKQSPWNEERSEQVTKRGERSDKDGREPERTRLKDSMRFRQKEPMSFLVPSQKTISS